MYDRPEELVDFLCKYKLSGHQFLIAYLLYVDKIQDRGDDKPGGPSLSMKYAVTTKELGVDLLRDVDFDILIDRGFIQDHNRQGPVREYYPNMFTITDQFVEAVFLPWGAFEEFWDAYPSLIPDFKAPHSGKKVMLKGVPSKEAFKNYYLSKVMSSTLHNKIVQTVKYGKAKGIIQCRIDKFLESELYEGIWEMMGEADRSGEFNPVIPSFQFVPTFDNNAEEDNNK